MVPTMLVVVETVIDLLVQVLCLHFLSLDKDCKVNGWWKDLKESPDRRNPR